tara:strand:+ start:456 stop:2093 length:1638 start_codon:yes stop_codon:yes gene_type:complete
MAIDKFTSLLGKSSGTTFGELAGAYFSGGKKKNNRSRNIMFGTLLFNLRENKMRNKVMQNLQDWDDRKLIQNTELKNTYDNQLKLQTKYDTIQAKGIETYYEQEADDAFNKKVIADGMTNRYNGTNPSGNKAKLAWKNTYANEQYNKFLETYNPEDKDISRLSTYEKFSEPLLNIQKQEKREITDPTNLSLVHKVIGGVKDKLGFNTSKDTTLEKEYMANEELYNKQIKNNVRFATPVGRVNPNNIPLSSADSFLIPDNLVDNELTEYGINTNSKLYQPLMAELLAVPRSERNVAKVREVLSGGLTNTFALENKAAIKKVTEKYKSQKEELMKEGTYDLIIQRDVREELDMPDLEEDVYLRAVELTNLSIRLSNTTFKNDAARDLYIDESIAQFANADISKALGIKSDAQVRQAIMMSTAIEVSKSISEQSPATLAAARETSLPEEKMEILKIQNLEAYNFIKLLPFNGITDTRNDLEITNSPYSSLIRDLQGKQLGSNRSTSAINLLEYYSGKTPTTVIPSKKEIPGYSDEDTNDSQPIFRGPR